MPTTHKFDFSFVTEFSAEPDDSEAASDSIYDNFAVTTKAVELRKMFEYVQLIKGKVKCIPYEYSLGTIEHTKNVPIAFGQNGAADVPGNENEILNLNRNNVVSYPR